MSSSELDVRPRPAQNAATRKTEQMIRRAVDIAVASAVLVMLSPLTILIGLIIRGTSTGPALFTQIRVGIDRKPSY